MPMKRKKGLRVPMAIDVSVGYPDFFSVVVEGKLAGSAHPSKTSLRDQAEQLKEKENVQGILSATEHPIAGHEELASIDTDYLHLATVDKCPLSIRDLVTGSDFIDSVNAKGGVVLVHCKEGIGRTGTMLAGFMIVSLGMDAATAIADVRGKRTDSIHQRHQELRLYQLEKIARDKDKMVQVRSGTFEESCYDYRLLKAKCADILARLLPKTFLGVYYFKWLRYVTDRACAMTCSTFETQAITEELSEVEVESCSPRAHARSLNLNSAPGDNVNALLGVQRSVSNITAYRTESSNSVGLNPISRTKTGLVVSTKITVPKYLQAVRSPLWRPKLDLKGYLSQSCGAGSRKSSNALSRKSSNVCPSPAHRLSLSTGLPLSLPTLPPVQRLSLSASGSTQPTVRSVRRGTGASTSSSSGGLPPPHIGSLYPSLPSAGGGITCCSSRTSSHT